MTIQSVIERTAKRSIDQAGDAVTYHHQDGTDQSIKAVPNAGPLQTRQTDERRALSHKVLIAIAKLDVPTVVVNGDSVTVPGSWVQKDAPQRLRVSHLAGDRSDPGVWLLGLD